MAIRDWPSRLRSGVVLWFKLSLGVLVAFTFVLLLLVLGLVFVAVFDLLDELFVFFMLLRLRSLSCLVFELGWSLLIAFALGSFLDVFELESFLLGSVLRSLLFSA